MSRFDGATLGGSFDEPVVILTQAEADRLRAENAGQATPGMAATYATLRRWRAALEDIAAGECWQGRCPEGDLCDVCTARKALGAER